MKIASHQLAAFFETARLRSFSKAAEALSVTQSALSQRVSNLEAELEVTLFIRDSAGPVLTSAGETLLRHCQVASSLESEMLGQLKSSQGQLRGSVRVAGFSSILRSALVPSLAPFLRSHPFVQCEFSSHEMVDLPDILRSGEADFVVVDYHMNKKGVTEHLLAKEEYVVIESVKFQSPQDLYLDHGPDDNATELFFREQAQAPKDWRRSFMGDVYGIINGVELGLGRAVMSRHLIEGNSKVKIVKGFKKYHRDVTLNYFEQPYYSRLHQEIVSQLVKGAASFM